MGVCNSHSWRRWVDEKADEEASHPTSSCLPGCSMRSIFGRFPFQPLVVQAMARKDRAGGGESLGIKHLRMGMWKTCMQELGQHFRHGCRLPSATWHLMPDRNAHTAAANRLPSSGVFSPRCHDRGHSGSQYERERERGRGAERDCRGSRRARASISVSYLFLPALGRSGLDLNGTH